MAAPAKMHRKAENPYPGALPAMLDTLRVALTVFDAEARLTYANAHLGHLFASLPPVSSLIGISHDALMKMVIDGGEVAPSALAGGRAAFIAACRAQLLPGHYAPRDITLRGHRIVEVKARHDADGAAILLWNDVTQARDQFARLEEAVSLSTDAFAFFDRRDRLIMANARYAAFLGTTVDAVLNRSFGELIAMAAKAGRVVLEDDAEAWLARRRLSHQKPISHATIRTADGQAFLVRDRATPDGGRAVIFTDITDRVRAETALAEQESALERSRDEARRQSDYLADLARRLDHATRNADSAKTTLLRTMSHELKTPLNAILGFSGLMTAMAGKLGPDQIREYAELIQQGGVNLLKIINQVMDLTKISADRYELHRAPVDVGALLQAQCDDFEDMASRGNITLVAGKCPAGLMADADEGVLAAMLQGLIENAISHAGPGKRVTLAAARGNGAITLTVRDNGAGVAPDDLARIQEPFEHGGRAEAAQHARGAGLGLTLVKALAELHGGHLELASRKGHGFTARIHLPLSA